MTITPAQVAEWRRIIREQGALHSALAQRITPSLIDEIERAWAELDRHRRAAGARAAVAANIRRRLAEKTDAPAVHVEPALARARRPT